MIPNIYTNILYSLNYRPLQSNGKLDVFLKDTPTCYKVALLISNYGKARLVSSENLRKIKLSVLRLPELIYEKKVEFLSIIIHSDYKDQFLAGNNIISIAMNGGRDYYHQCSNIFHDEVTAFSCQREKVKASEKQLKSRNLKYNFGLPYVNLILSALCVFVYFMCPNMAQLAISSNTLLDWNFYTAFTYMFAHGSIIHLAGNVSALLILGNMLERRIGHLNYLLFCAFTGVYSGLIASIYRAFVGQSTKTVGMSGVIFAICSALIIYQYKECKRGYVSIIIYMLLNYFFGMINPNTDNLVHLSGIFSGIAGMVLIYAIQFIKRNKADRKFYQINTR